MSPLAIWPLWSRARVSASITNLVLLTATTLLLDHHYLSLEPSTAIGYMANPKEVEMFNARSVSGLEPL